MSGSIVTNLCVDHATSAPVAGDVDCIEQSIPDPQYATTPAGIATLGRVGLRYLLFLTHPSRANAKVVSDNMVDTSLFTK